MPLGVNNAFISVALDDIGSQIAFGLNSNAYLETLVRENYMGLESLVIKNAGGASK